MDRSYPDYLAPDGPAMYPEVRPRTEWPPTRDPSGTGEVRCPDCSDLLREYPSEMHDALSNIQPGYIEEMRSEMDAIVQGQLEADENQAWQQHDLDWRE